MYESLKKYSYNFHLFIFAFDDRSYNLLKQLNLECVTVISLLEFEDDALLKIKQERTPGEYCWTCTPSVIKYAIEQYQLSNCTYLDADLYFFSNPSVLIDEMEDKSVLITEHRYTHIYDQTETSGKYCVQFMTFKNNAKGMQVLNWWQKACNEWCYNRFEDGKFGDQMYLDNWMTKFDGVHELQHLGGGVAPWNAQQYNFAFENKKIIGTENATDKKFDLVFFHFHALKVLNKGRVDCSLYKLDKQDIALLYKEYVTALSRITSDLNKIDPGFDYNYDLEAPINIKAFLSKLKRLLKGTYNIHRLDKLKRM